MPDEFQEIPRPEVLQTIECSRILQKLAAERLKLTARQTRRLQERLRKGGVPALALLRRVRPGNHRLAPALIVEVLRLLHTRYQGFGPTLAREKLRAMQILRISVEALRQFMIQ